MPSALIGWRVAMGHCPVGQPPNQRRRKHVPFTCAYVKFDRKENRRKSLILDAFIISLVFLSVSVYRKTSAFRTLPAFYTVGTFRTSASFPSGMGTTGRYRLTCLCRPGKGFEYPEPFHRLRSTEFTPLISVARVTTV